MKRHLSSARIVTPLLVCVAACAGPTADFEPGATTDDPLYGLGGSADAWPGGVVPVCFQSPSARVDLQTSIRLILADTWAKHANVRFTGFGACPRRSTGRVSVQFANDSNGWTTSLGFGQSSITLIGNDTSTDQRHFRYEVIHEFGHALGFMHEQERPDNWENGQAVYCSQTQGDRKAIAGGDYYTTSFDSASVMNYCAGWAQELSAGDVAGIRRAYGVALHPALAPADYDGDGKTDLAIKDDAGSWYIDYASNGFGRWQGLYRGYGGSGVVPVPADYDGDGKADLAVKDPSPGSSYIGAWYIDYAADGFGAWNEIHYAYGDASAIPVPADYDGDGKADLAVKGSDGGWLIDYAADGFGSWNEMRYGYGDASAIPVPADYDGDGKADLAVKGSDGGWLIDYAADGFGAWNEMRYGYGDASAIPVPADYDGDGKADLAVKGSDGGWLIDYAADGFGAWNEMRYGYGDASAIPVPADYDGDGKADLAVQSGYWYIDYAKSGFGAWDEYK